ncbi:MAG TPA: CBS domain-containing protein [Candidatus Nanoarchaeia archaeon]|nr:CBS domain-containing protein [Candidatus Nanoarchaeia archaeon]
MAKVRKVMLTDVPTLKKEDKVEEAARLLTKTDNGCLIIVENDVPIGILTELDIVRHIKSKNIMKQPVSSIMSSPVRFMTPDMKLDEALKIIDTKRFRKYPVIENNRLVGLVTKNDVILAISDNMKLHRAIQNIVLILFVLFELFVFILYEPLKQYLGG